MNIAPTWKRIAHPCRRLVLSLALATVATIPATRGLAQSTMEWPVGDVRPYPVDSTALDNAADTEAVVYGASIRVDGVAWLRLHFAKIALAPGSFIRMTSVHDGEVQRLDAGAAAMWRNASAYFNGNDVRLELVAAPGTHGNRFVLAHVTAQAGQADAGSCGICDGDDRVPSSEDFAPRLMPSGCSSTVWNTGSCVVTAGHCVAGDDLVQFRVPPSNPDCTLNHPPVDEQFPILETIFVNDGPGNDWATMSSGTNGLGQTPYERYEVFMPIAPRPVSDGDDVTVWGYGIDDECTRSSTQQTSGGVINGVFATRFTHDADTTFGNSGSCLVHDGEIVGIATHCGCPNNTATRVDHPEFVAARNQMCGCLGDANFDGRVDFGDILKVLNNWGQSGVPADVNGDGVVDFGDILVILSAWGDC